MKTNLPKELGAHEVSMTEKEFLASFNANMPEGYPHVTSELLRKFKTDHPSLFKNDTTWTLDHHRKALITWLPQNM
jgi:hypothetical protein